MKYNSNLLEDWIKDFYCKIDIYHPHQLDLSEIGARLGLYIHFERFSSRIYNGEIIIDSRLSPQEQWEDFGHELCHLLRHYGNQTYMTMPFLDYQETQAENFALHFCVPTFMLFKNQVANYVNVQDGIPFVTEKFNVTEKFAKKRLIHFRNQIQQSKTDQEFRKHMNLLYPKSSPDNWSNETKLLLDKLNKQIKVKELQGV
ncbi:ImmA/IrrE family metallo-endopeptidase [Metabacillus sp. FJAT-53654]|uniref:ImmA/IrrE family metallo-endopeptidase n=1 Tax=Metabacillus rhizosphaerae TaxID=3117747 RepID=A0ABZ2MY74_9BACI